MGLFDLFGRNPKNEEEIKNSRYSAPNLSSETKPRSNAGPISVFSPKSYNDIAYIIDALKENKTAVVHLTELKTETATRVLDMLSGAVYALGGGTYEMQKNVFMFSPTGVELN